MKSKIALRILIITVLLSLLSVVFPDSSVYAAREISLSPLRGSIGTLITITGTEFNKSTDTADRYAAIIFSSEEATTLDDIGVQVTRYEIVAEGVWLDYDGNFETTFRVPEVLDDGSRVHDVTSGTYYVYICHYQSSTPPVLAPRIRAVATFTVTKGSISLLPSRGTVGTLIEVRGTEFIGNRNILFKYDGSLIPVQSGSTQTNNQGNFASIIRIPESTAGPHIITTGVSGDEASATFSVEPEISISTASGRTGNTVAVSGTGFLRRAPITIWFYDIAVAQSVTNIQGSFNVSFTVPDLAAGLYNIDADDGLYIAKARFSLIETPPPSPPPPSPPPPSPPPPSPVPSPALSLSATTGHIGQGIVMAGSGFRPNTNVTIHYNNQLLTAVTTDAGGVFAAAFNVPASRSGTHVIKASDGENTSEIQFTVESDPPPVPQLLSPQSGEKLVSPVSFNWQAVTDPSLPVTYDIQVATASDFSASSIVFEQTGLSSTQYALLEAERLRLGISESPYYWRVRAIDGASNEGNWANPLAFYVVSGGFPVWAIIVIAVLGVMLLLAIGYFILMKKKTT